MSRKLLLSGLLGLAICAVPAVMVAAAPGSAAPKGDVAAGRALYAEKGCLACHGPAGEGAGTGPPVAGAALAFGAYHAQVRAPRGNMPAYGQDMMSDQQIADTYAYLASLAPPQGAPRASTVQLKGDPRRGRTVYLENGCHACHGSVGQGGGPGPIVAATPMTQAAYHDQLRRPRSVMPAYGPTLMTDQEVADTYAYVKGLPGPRAPDRLPALLRP